MEEQITSNGSIVGWHRLASYSLLQIGNARPRRMAGLVFALGIKTRLLFLALLLACLSVWGATHTNVLEFEKSLAKPGSFQWQANQRINQERQELHRKRLTIVGATDLGAPRAASARLINGVGTQPVPPEMPTQHTFGGGFLFTALFFLTGALILQRTNPQFLAGINQQFNPWAMPPKIDRVYPAQVRTEEKTFGEFVAALQAGPDSNPVGLEAANDSQAEFFARAKKRLARQRQLLADIEKNPNDALLKKFVMELYYELVAMKADANVPELLPVWQTTSALEGLVKQMTDKIRNATPSALRTIGGGLDLLESLCVSGLSCDLLTNRPFKFLVVDDDLVTRHALSLSLKKAFSQPDLAVNGEAALVHVAEQAYDVIFLDVHMPGMDGFELCTKIRASDLNRAAPVVFVTGQSDFDSRAKSVLSGGNDLMGKPFLIFEVAVKALTLALQSRIRAGECPPCGHLRERDPVVERIACEKIPV